MKKYLILLLFLPFLSVISSSCGSDSETSPDLSDTDPGSIVTPEKTYKNVTDFCDLSTDFRSLHCDGTGGLFVTMAYQLYKVNSAGTPSLYIDNSASNTPFNLSRGMAIDNSGNLYIANDMNHDILKVTGGTASVFLGTTGTLGNDNTAGSVAFSRPYDVAFDGNNNILYVADSANSRIRKIELSNSNTVSDFVNFSYVYSVNVDSSGNVYACSSTSNEIRKFSSVGTFLNTYTITSTNTPELYDLAVSTDGTIYTVDYKNYVIWKVATDGTISLFAGKVGEEGEANETLLNSTFSYITGIEIDSDGTIYIADTNNQKIRRIVLE